jgi:hypothetical protein
MLDVGIASTRWIAAGWGIAARDAPRQETQGADEAAERPRTAGMPLGRMGVFAERGPESVRHTIEGALKAAGLMR